MATLSPTLTPGLPRSFSETSFLLISPLQGVFAASPSRWLYSLPILAAGDALATVILGILIAGREEMGLVVWGLVRAAVVGWVGWGRGVRKGGSGGGGWVASTSMVSLLLVFWQLNLLFQTRSPAHRPPPPTGPPSNATAAVASLDAEVSLSRIRMHGGDPLHGRGLEPHYVFLLTTTLFAFLEYIVFLSLNRLLPPPPHTPRAGAFAIRTPKQFPSPHPHQTTSISSNSLQAGPSISQTNPAHFLHAQRHRSHLSQSSIPPNASPDRDPETAGFYSESDDGSDISDSEIVDIAPVHAAQQPSRSDTEGGGLTGENREAGALERSLSRSFSRRSRLIAEANRSREYGTFAEGGAEEGGAGEVSDSDEDERQRR